MHNTSPNNYSFIRWLRVRPELTRQGLTYALVGLVAILTLLALLALVQWAWTTWFGTTLQPTFGLALATLATLICLTAAYTHLSKFVDYLFFPQTITFTEEIDRACRKLPQFKSKAELERYLTRELPSLLNVWRIKLYLNEAAPHLDASMMLLLETGGRSMGIMTIDTLNPDQIFSTEALEALNKLQRHVSWALSGLQLAHLRHEAEKVSQLRNNLLTSISHELRTPLNAIINAAGLVADEMLGPVTQPQADNLNRAIEGAEYLMHLLDEILDITKLDTNQLELFPEPIALPALIDDITPMVKTALATRPITFAVDIPDDLPPITADRLRVRQILLNLISNAVKFTETGHIRLWAKAEPSLVVIQVEDTGCGIPPERLQFIFEDYRQMSGSNHAWTRRDTLATGLGMPITRGLVELHGGFIRAESKVGHGSTFTFTLPRHD